MYNGVYASSCLPRVCIKVYMPPYVYLRVYYASLCMYLRVYYASLCMSERDNEARLTVFNVGEGQRGASYRQSPVGRHLEVPSNRCLFSRPLVRLLTLMSERWPSMGPGPVSHHPVVIPVSLLVGTSSMPDYQH